MDHLYRITQPTGLMGYSRNSRHGAGEDNQSTGRNRAGSANDGSDGRDFASVLAKMMAR